MKEAPHIPQAFPTPGSKYENGIVNVPQPGMNLRDYFAGQALSGFVAQPNITLAESPNKSDAELVAEACYEFADAMIKVR